MEFKATRTSNNNSWKLEFTTIEDLMKFVELSGEVIISVEEGAPCLEIYDDWRE